MVGEVTAKFPPLLRNGNAGPKDEAVVTVDPDMQNVSSDRGLENADESQVTRPAIEGFRYLTTEQEESE